jgi:hypothetical protein
MVPKKKQGLNKAAAARRKVESAELYKNMGKFKTGEHQNPATKRIRTRSAANKKAVDDFKE